MHFTKTPLVIVSSNTICKLLSDPVYSHNICTQSHCQEDMIHDTYFNQMFNRAKIVVAPHGAGLSNVMFSEPGTVVIEGVCNPPIVNLCYQTTAYILGHRYHGLLSKGGCERSIDISTTNIKQVLSVYLNQRRGH